MTEHLIKLATELEDLDGKLWRLQAFKGTREFDELDIGNQDLLRKQEIAMKEYRSFLSLRVYLAAKALVA